MTGSMVWTWSTPVGLGIYQISPHCATCESTPDSQCGYVLNNWQSRGLLQLHSPGQSHVPCPYIPRISVASADPSQVPASRCPACDVRCRQHVHSSNHSYAVWYAISFYNPRHLPKPCTDSSDIIDGLGDTFAEMQIRAAKHALSASLRATTNLFESLQGERSFRSLIWQRNQPGFSASHHRYVVLVQCAVV